MQADVLIIDDRELLCSSLATSFRERGHTAIYAQNRRDALSKLLSFEIGVVVLDVKLGDENGLDVLIDIVKLKRDIPVIMITGHGTINMAVDALKSGAIDFIEKPVPFPSLFRVFQKALSLKNVGESLRRGDHAVGMSTRDRFVTGDDAMVQLLVDASNLANSDLPVLVEGESGTGKELVAEFIHSCSKRADEDIVKINCSAFPETLLDNELFGHEPGAFTDARDRYRGVFERADRGTLFLDEVGDMPVQLQPRVLRVLQSGEFRRLGGEQDIRADVRCIAATNRDLNDLIAEKKFREDLYYRVNAARIVLPPLRARPHDIALLATHFLERSNSITSRDISFGSDVLSVFESYSWPGNVRELQNAVLYGAAVTTSDKIEIDNLPSHIKIEHSDGDARINPTLEASERRTIERALRDVRYNKKRAAELLSISRATLYKKIEKYGIAIPR